MKIEVINEFYTTSLRDGVQTKADNIPVHLMRFPGGEQHVRIDMERARELIQNGSTIIIHQEVRDSAAFMSLVMAKNALDNIVKFMSNVKIELVMLYIPYARQDRVCEPGEPFGIYAFAELLNSLNFYRVTVADPHSDVAATVIKNLHIIPQEDIASYAVGLRIKSFNMSLVSPDGGALKKIYKLAKKQGVDVICAEKIRDTRTGEIVNTRVPVEDFEGRHLMIVDDICDGGRTFIELAKVLKERNAGRVELFVTHGIFSKGVDIFHGFIDTIYSMNVWEDNLFLQNNHQILVENQQIIKDNFV